MTNLELQKAIAKRDRIQALSLLMVESEPWVEIKLQGRVLKLEYSYDAVVEVFKATGLDIGVTQITMAHVGDPNVFPTLLESGLRTHNGEFLTDLSANGHKVTSLVPMRHLSYVHTCIMLALQATEPSPEEVQRVLDAVDKEFTDDGGQESLPLQDAPVSEDSGRVVPIAE